MNASEIIQEISKLPADEKAKVAEFLHQRDSAQATPAELVRLADRMVRCRDPKEAEDLERRILEGFYGR